MHLSEISAELEKLWDHSVKGGVSPHTLEVVLPTDSKEPVLVRGNREGLIYLARVCVNLAEKKTEGSHFHLDQHSMLSTDAASLIVAYRHGPLDNEYKAQQRPERNAGAMPVSPTVPSAGVAHP